MRTRQLAFSLIELLVVIAVIAILAAILTPVFARAREAAYRNSDIGHMNQLRTALGMYEVDQGGYPPALLGYVTLYASGPNAGNVIPANDLKSYIYPRRVGIDVLEPAYGEGTYTDLVSATYPRQDPRAVGSAPQMDLDGDGDIDADDDVLGNRQAYGPADGPVVYDSASRALIPGICAGVGCDVFYRVSGYDVAPINDGGVERTEVHYTLFWTNFAIGTAPGFGGGSPNDDPRQLGYSDPPDDTVITWNSYFRSMDGPAPLATNKDIILTLGGSARTYDSRQLFDYSWRQGPVR